MLLSVITLLAYVIMGKDINLLTEEHEAVDWKSEISKLWGHAKDYGMKVGRDTCQKVMHLYYVLKDGETTTLLVHFIDNCIIFAARFQHCRFEPNITF